MKNTALKTSALAIVLALLSIPTIAHPGGHPPEFPDYEPPAQPGAPVEKLPETAAETLKAIDAQQAQMKTALDDGRLNVVQTKATSINKLVQHLVTQMPADKKTGVQEIASRNDQLTTALVKSSAAGAKKETQSNMAKLTANLSALKTKAQ